MITQRWSPLRAGLVLLLAVGASAQEAPASVETQAQGIFRSVMSPYCPGQLLATCPSSAADELRDDIRADLRRGRSAGEIEAGLYTRFGDVVRATPQPRGAGLFVWMVPLALFLGGGLLFAAWLRRVRPPANAVAEPLPLARDLLDRLEDELSRD